MVYTLEQSCRPGIISQPVWKNKSLRNPKKLSTRESTYWNVSRFQNLINFNPISKYDLARLARLNFFSEQILGILPNFRGIREVRGIEEHWHSYQNPLKLLTYQLYHSICKCQQLYNTIEIIIVTDEE